MATSTRKPRKTRAEWQKLVNDFATAGQSVTDFCKSRQVSYPSFSKWRATLQAGAEKVPVPSLDFLELSAPRPTTNVSLPDHYEIELVLGDQIILRIRRVA